MTDLSERRSFVRADIADIHIRDSATGDGSYTIRGHAAVFDKLSLDLGGFREKVAPTAFDRVLTENPDVLAVWDHDTRYTLARTHNKTLELRTDPYGLHVWMRVAPTSYAQDLRVLMERGDINQASWMFTIERETWTITEQANGDELVIATIEEVGDLYDVTVTGRGAYPQTDMSVAQGRSARFEQALREGRVPGLTLDQARTRGLVTGDPEPAPDQPAGEDADAPMVVSDNRRAHAAKVAAMRRRRAA